MITEIIQKGSPILRTKCKQVTDFSEIQGIIDNLIDTIEYLKTTYDFSRGIGLAAHQIGELVKIAIIENKRDRYILINPEIIEKSDKKEPIWEGCLSFFKYRAYVPRHTNVKVRYQDQDGLEKYVEGNGDFAASLQHEIDHLNGILYIDHLKNGEKDLKISDKP